MTTSTSGAETPAPQPLTSSSEIIKVAFERLAELQQQIDKLSAVTDLHASVLDDQAAIASRLSQRLNGFEDDAEVAPRISLPPSTIGHNPRPGKLRREAGLNSKPRKKGKK